MLKFDHVHFVEVVQTKRTNLIALKLWFSNFGGPWPPFRLSNTCGPLVITRAGEPEHGAMEPANFGGPRAGAGAFLNIFAEPELEPQKFY